MDALPYLRRWHLFPCLVVTTIVVLFVVFVVLPSPTEPLQYSSCTAGAAAPPPFRRPSQVFFPVAQQSTAAAIGLSLQCKRAFGFLESPAAVAWPPPCPAPSHLAAAYERHGLPILRSWCFAQRYEGEGEYTLDWNEAFVVDYCAEVSRGASAGSYSAEVVGQVRHAMQVMALRQGAAPSLEGTVGLVMGSEQPWVECLALNLGADAVWTWEYGRIVSTHPRLKAKPYKAMAADIASGALGLFDWVATFSSLEHSGLGRYGDALNPEGDAEALQQALCMLKPGGVLLLGLPSVCKFTGFIEYNAHRVYGYERLAHIAKDFELVGFTDACGGFHIHAGRIVLLRKPFHEGRHTPLTAAVLAEASEAPLQSQC
jgi:hypothetical protein